MNIRLTKTTTRRFDKNGAYKEAKLCGLCLVVLWLVFVLPGVLYGLPQILDPDEPFFVKGALRILVPPYLDPEWYGAPASVLMDILAPLYAGYYFAAKFFVQVGSPEAFAMENIHVFVLIGRVVTAFSMLLASAVLYRILRGLCGSWPSLAGAVSFMLAPEVVHYGQITRTDMFLILFLLLVLHYAIKLMDAPSLKNCLLAGCALGAAVVSKYPGVVGAVTIIVALAIAHGRGRISLGRGVRYLLASALASVFAAFVLGPYLFLNFPGMLEDVLHEARNRHLSGTGQGFWKDMVFYATHAAPRISGFGAVAAGAAGLAVALWGRNRAKIVLFVCFGVCFLVFISLLSLRWVRWALPLAPVFAVGVAALMDRVSTIGFSRARGALVAALAVAVLAPPAVESGGRTLLKSLNRDTRILAQEWVLSNIPENSRVAVETYAPQISMDTYRVLVPFNGEIRDAREVWEHRKRPPAFFRSFGSNTIDVEELAEKADYVVISDWEDRYSREKMAFPEEYEVYTEIRRRFKEVRSFFPSDRLLGNAVTVFRTPGG